MIYSRLFFFFFQAEDSIRDAQESRGLGDVYKRQVASVIRDRIVEVCDCEGKTVAKGDVLARLDDGQVRAGLKELKAREDFIKREMSRAVSYTHLRAHETPEHLVCR